MRSKAAYSPLIRGPYVIAEGIEDKCPKSLREAARAFRAQAEDFYEASAGNRLPHAKPLLIYYSFLNLVKALILIRGHGGTSYRPKHRMSKNAKLREAEGARITVCPSSLKERNLFADFWLVLSDYRLRNVRRLRFGFLPPQILFGYRLWCSAAEKRDRFVPIQKIEFRHDPGSKSIWLRLEIKRDELARANHQSI
jgi:YaaC-like Protein